jgi:mannose-6-phosphate isomerase-like protein (cupin superfamily)
MSVRSHCRLSVRSELTLVGAMSYRVSVRIDLADCSVELLPGQGFVVPRGVKHCTRAPQRSVVLMIEAVTVKPTGD